MTSSAPALTAPRSAARSEPVAPPRKPCGRPSRRSLRLPFLRVTSFVLGLAVTAGVVFGMGGLLSPSFGGPDPLVPIVFGFLTLPTAGAGALVRVITNHHRFSATERWLGVVLWSASLIPLATSALFGLIASVPWWFGYGI